jgi:hypothetical protein
MARNRAVLRVEELDGRTVPSAVPLAPLTTTAAVSTSVQHPLAGNAQGSYTTGRGIPGVGQTYRLTGTGTFAGLGKGKVRGSVHTPGFIAQGQAGGTLTFSNAKGSVTVQLQSMSQPGFSSLPQWFHYQVAGGTGAYKHLTDQGTLRLDVTAAPTARSLGSHAGTFILRI